MSCRGCGEAEAVCLKARCYDCCFCKRVLDPESLLSKAFGFRPCHTVRVLDTIWSVGDDVEIVSSVWPDLIGKSAKLTEIAKVLDGELRVAVSLPNPVSGQMLSLFCSTIDLRKAQTIQSSVTRNLACRGERCHCGRQASHKIEEEVFNEVRHGLSRYLCEECFTATMQPYTFTRPRVEVEPYTTLRRILVRLECRRDMNANTTKISDDEKARYDSDVRRIAYELVMDDVRTFMAEHPCEACGSKDDPKDEPKGREVLGRNRVSCRDGRACLDRQKTRLGR